ncbi:MAG: hypothetical protein ACXWE5_11805 [Actinomycetota bacterium]
MTEAGGEAGRAPRVRFVDAEPNGLASMVGGLIEQNLARDRSRARLLTGGAATLVAPDAGVEVTVRLGPREVVVANGADPAADLVVTAASGRLLALAGAPLRLGLPDGLTTEGRAVLRDLAARRVTIEGMGTHPGLLRRLTMLLSAH